MVSQVESSHSLTVRGPSSVVSRSSRRHRHGRSHAGGTSYIPQNDFPIFSHSGDVEIIVKAGDQTNRYVLHRLYLAQCSGFFEASTSQEWSRAQNEARDLSTVGEESGNEVVRAGEVKKRWRYELDAGTSEDDIPMLVQKENTTGSLFGTVEARPPPVRNKPPTSNPSFFRSVANLSLSSSHSAPPPKLTQEDQDLLNDYDNLFRIFYNYAPALDAIDIATAYIQCKSLLTLADLYDALAVVGPRVDHHLLQFQSRLWKQIAKYPSSYLRLGYLAQSKSIFQEALIHVAGAWPMGERYIRNSLPSTVLDIIEDKVQDLDDTISKIERKLFRLTLLTSRGERVTPANSYLDWLVISLFRQWLVENTTPVPIPPPPQIETHPRSRHLPPPSSTTRTSISNTNTTTKPSPQQQHTNPNLGRIYRALGSAPSTYLTHDECKRFLRLTPELYSRDNVRRFERRLDEVKALAREVVMPLMGCALFGEGASVGYLVCTRVEERDFPWGE